MKTKEEKEEETEFKCRSYSKSELAQLYSPFTTPKTAVDKLNRWIDHKPGLRQLLTESGLIHSAKCYTPAQVRLIVEGIGEP